MDADWYPDPSNPSQQRFWDGVSWTNHVYGAQGQGADGGLQGAPPPGGTADFPSTQPAPPASPGYPQAAPPSYPPPGGGAYTPGYGAPSGSSTSPGYGPSSGGGYGSPSGAGYAPPPGQGYGPPPAYGPPPGYGPPGAGYSAQGGPPAAWSGGHGPIGQTTSIGIQILLTIVTLGIWSLVWTYRQYRDMKNYTGAGVGGGWGLVIGLFVGVVNYFLIPSEVKNMYEREGQPAPVSAVYGLIAFIPLAGPIIWYVLVQQAINRFWVARGAPPP